VPDFSAVDRRAPPSGVQSNTSRCKDTLPHIRRPRPGTAVPASSPSQTLPSQSTTTRSRRSGLRSTPTWSQTQPKPHLHGSTSRCHGLHHQHTSPTDAAPPRRHPLSHRNAAASMELQARCHPGPPGLKSSKSHERIPPGGLRRPTTSSSTTTPPGTPPLAPAPTK
jgi:hypothetical protein